MKPEINFPDTKENGLPLDTIENLEALMSAYGITASGFSKSVQGNVDLKLQNNPYTLDNGDFFHQKCLFFHLTSLACKHELPTGNMRDYLSVIAGRK